LPSIMKIYPITLPCIFGMKTVNAFILKGDEVVLIDSGENTDESYAAMIAGLKSHQLEVTDIDRIVITHAHVDHIGMAQRVAEAANAKVWVSEKTHPYALDPTAQWGIRKNLIKSGRLFTCLGIVIHKALSTTIVQEHI